MSASKKYCVFCWSPSYALPCAHHCSLSTRCGPPLPQQQQLSQPLQRHSNRHQPAASGHHHSLLISGSHGHGTTVTVPVLAAAAGSVRCSSNWLQQTVNSPGRAGTNSLMAANIGTFLLGRLNPNIVSKLCRVGAAGRCRCVLLNVSVHHCLCVLIGALVPCICVARKQLCSKSATRSQSTRLAAKIFFALHDTSYIHSCMHSYIHASLYLSNTSCGNKPHTRRRINMPILAGE
jgi:hypothetical protein